MFPLDLSFLYVYKPVKLNRDREGNCKIPELEKVDMYIEKDECIVRGTSRTSVANR